MENKSKNANKTNDGANSTVYGKYIDDLGKERGKSRKKIVVFVVLALLIIVFAVVSYIFLSNYFQAYEFRSMLESQSGDTNKRDELLRSIVSGKNPYCEEILYEILEKGRDPEKILAIETLEKMNSQGIKEACRELWLNKTEVFSVRQRALSAFTRKAVKEDTPLFMDAICELGGFGISEEFLQNYADRSYVIEAAINFANSSETRDRLRAACILLAFSKEPEVQNSLLAKDKVKALLFDASREVARMASIALPNIASPGDEEFLAKVLETHNDPSSDAYWIRRYVIESLGNLNSVQAAVMLADILAVDLPRQDDHIADALVKVGKYNEEEVDQETVKIRETIVDRLITIINDRDNMRVGARVVAARVLGAFPIKKSIDTLVISLRTDRSMAVALAVTRALGKSGNIRPVPAMAEILVDAALDDEQTELRVEIINALGNIKSISAIPALVATLQKQRIRNNEEVDAVGRAIDNIIKEVTGEIKLDFVIKSDLSGQELEKRLELIKEWYATINRDE